MITTGNLISIFVLFTIISFFPQLRRCYFKNCLIPVPPPPPEKRPLQYLTWSDPDAWYGTEPGYGGYNKQLPEDGNDVMIKEGK